MHRTYHLHTAYSLLKCAYNLQLFVFSSRIRAEHEFFLVLVQDYERASRVSQLPNKNLKKRGIRFYLTEHIAGLNDQLRELGFKYMIEEGAVRRTIHIALKDMGITRPYPLEGNVENVERSAIRKRFDNRIQEFTWAFGKETEAVIEHQIHLQVEKLKKSHDIDALLHGNWGYKEAMDKKEWLDHLQEHLGEIIQAAGMDEQELFKKLEENREEVQQKILEERPDLEEELLQQKEKLDEELKKKYSEVCRKIQRIRKEN